MGKHEGGKHKAYQIRGRLSILTTGIREGLAEMIFKQRLAKRETVSSVVVWRKGIRGKKQSKHRGPEIRACLV